MGVPIEMKDEHLQELRRYCTRSHAEFEAVLERCVRTWLNGKIQKEYRENPDQVEKIRKKLQEIRPGESDLSTVNIDAEWARGFKKMCNHWDFDKAAMATMLVDVFLQAHNIKKMNEIKDKRDTPEFGSLY